MSKIPLEDLLKQVDSEFRLIVMAAKRAKQLHNEAKPLVKTETTKDILVALEEIAAGKIGYRKTKASREGLT